MLDTVTVVVANDGKKAESRLESVPMRLKKKVRKHSRIKAKIRRKKMKWRKRIWCTEHKCMGKTMYNTCRIHPWIRCNIQTDMSTWNKEERKNGSVIFFPCADGECSVRRSALCDAALAWGGSWYTASNRRDIRRRRSSVIGSVGVTMAPSLMNSYHAPASVCLPTGHTPSGRRYVRSHWQVFDGDCQCSVSYDRNTRAWQRCMVVFRLTCAFHYQCSVSYDRSTQAWQKCKIIMLRLTCVLHR